MSERAISDRLLSLVLVMVYKLYKETEYDIITLHFKIVLHDIERNELDFPRDIEKI